MALAQVDPFSSNSEDNAKGYVSYSPQKTACNVGRKELQTRTVGLAYRCCCFITIQINVFLFGESFQQPTLVV